jgi:tetratricopeptide (TPR) repeat protein
MITSLVYRDRYFYPAVLAAWVLGMCILYIRYSFSSAPQTSIDLRNFDTVLHQKQIIMGSILELQKALTKEQDPVQRMHIYHNIGIAWYDLHSVDREKGPLDTAIRYFEKSIESNPPIARFYYNLGRAYTTAGDHAHAEAWYEKTLTVNPDHILALHNLGLLNYFEKHDRPRAREYLLRLLAVRNELPICNYVLGEIAMEDDSAQNARRYYEQEIAIFEKLRLRPLGLPMSSDVLRYAAAMSHRQLMLLHSTRFADQAKAQEHFHQYLSLETDPARRQETIDLMKRYWVVKN